jgi:MtrB/PioB family decaheme-associated outer membrane protein
MLTSNSHHRVRRTVALTACLCGLSTQAFPETSAPDISSWECKWCLFDSMTTTRIEVGAGNVSSSSFKFGQATGLGEEGGFLGTDFDSRHMGEQGKYWSVSGWSLGSDLIRFVGEAGRQGKFGVTVEYDQLPWLSHDTAVTPYQNLAANARVLPREWVRAETTDGLTALPTSLDRVAIKHERKRAEIGAYYLFNSEWDVSARFRQDEKTGSTSAGRAIGGSLIAGFPFLTQSAVFTESIDYITHTSDATLTYSGKQTNFAFGVLMSIFEQQADPVIWNNAFLPLTGVDADNGLLSLDPDNHFYRVHVSGGHRFAGSTRLTGRVAYSTATQDDSFWPASINPNIPSALPRGSLDGQVDILSGTLRLSSRPLPRLSVAANLSYRDRDNQVSQATYNYVITDGAASNTPRTNLPYSFTRQAFDLSGTYRLAGRTRVAFGYDYDQFERTLQDVNDNKENTLWGKLSLSPHQVIDIDLKLAYSDRDASASSRVPEVQPAQSPYMRKYNMAPRTRDLVTGTVTLTPGNILSLSLSGQYVDDEYSATILGLSSSKERGYTVDVSIAPSNHISLAVFLTVEKLETEQFQSENQMTPTWSATTEDSFNTVGASLRYGMGDGRVGFGLEFLRSDAKGKTGFQSDDPGVTPLPELENVLNSLRAYVDFDATENLLVRVSYVRENYNSLDWALDNVDPDTIPNVLWTGEQSFNYDVNVPYVSFRYRFGSSVN